MSTYRRAFTLVEMTIVIGIIVLLAALTLAVSVAVVEGAEVRQTKSTIRLLDEAIHEWEAMADRQVTYGIPNQPPGSSYEIQMPDPHDHDLALLRTSELLTIISRSAPIKQILSNINADFVEQYQDPYDPTITRMRLRDAWGEPIVAVFPGRKWVPGDTYFKDADGTIRTPLEEICGGAANRQICFVSAGPDGRFGNLSMDVDDPDFELAQDNVSSYPPVIPEQSAP